MKFKIAIKKGKKHLLKIQMDDGKEKWMETTETVFKYAKNQFEEDDEIGITYIKKNGQYYVSRVNKDGEVEEKEEEKDEEKVDDDGVKRCEDCGKELKNPKYDKCYECNKKNPSKPQKNMETQDSIKTQSAYKIAAIALQVFTGQIEDLDTLKSQLDEIANHLLRKF